MTLTRRTILALALMTGISPAVAQQFPTVPDHSFIGRLGVGGSSGPSQAIPFTYALAALGGAQSANTVWAGPTSGFANTPGFRLLVGADIPPINLAAGAVNGGVTGVAPFANGGTGQTTRQAAFDALAPTPTRAGDIVYWNGSHWVPLAGNNSGTQILTENSSGLPSWAAAGGVSSVTCGTGLSGGVITTTGTCAVNYAAKSDQQTGTSTVLAVNPAIQQQHDSAAKAWGLWTGSTGALISGYNITSVSRTSAGIYVVTFTVPFATSTYSCQATSETLNAGLAGEVAIINSATRATGTVGVNTSSQTGTAADPNVVHILCFGRQ